MIMIITAASRWWLMIAVVLALLGCGKADNGDKVMTSTVQISAAEWQTLAKTRVVFGHQSVGQNILSGVQTLAAQAGINLPVTESRGPAVSGGITHFFVGHNEDPLSKFKDFTSTLENGMAQNADIALMKLCYIDFNSSTNAKQLAEQYIAMLDRLSQQFPNITFVAVTAPLTIMQTGPKAWIKRLLGRTPSGYADNARRQEFNDLLRARYSQQGRLFDLARIEAEGAGVLECDGRPIEVLNPTLTYDGGHLNAQGEQRLAQAFLTFLAQHSAVPH